MNNAIYDNINMENVRNHVDIKLITIWENITRRQWSWNWIFTAAVWILCGESNRRRNAQTREVRQAVFTWACAYWTCRKSACTNFITSTCIAAVTAVSQKMQNYIHWHRQSHLSYKMRRCVRCDETISLDSTRAIVQQTMRTVCLSQIRKYNEGREQWWTYNDRIRRIQSEDVRAGNGRHGGHYKGERCKEQRRNNANDTVRRLHSIFERRDWNDSASIVYTI